MIYLLISKMIPGSGKIIIRPKTEGGLFDSVAHHLGLNSRLLTFTSRKAGVWAVWEESRGFVGRIVELRPQEDMGTFKIEARETSALLKANGF